MNNEEKIARTAFAQFVSSTNGRIARVILGIVIIAVGFFLRHQTAGIILMIFGLLPLFAGAFDICILTGVVGNKWSGSWVRQCAKPKS